MNKTNEKITFESAMTRLNEISKEMESVDLTLDYSMKLYKEAVELVSFCKEYIANSKLSLEKINSEV